MNQVKSICIVGGGTAAWMAAAHFKHNLPGVQITVVDKEIGNSVGVGEGTTEHFKLCMTESGFPRSEWFSAVDATFKAGIYYTNWHKEGNHLWQPFSLSLSLNDKQKSMDLWTQAQDLSMNEYTVQGYKICVEETNLDPSITYAYHVDAGKLVEYIQGKLKESIRFVKSEVVTINRNDDQFITSLVLKDEQIIEADFFVDCTGFRSILHQSPEKITLEGRLFCDTAVCGRIPYDDPKQEWKPYTIADAVEHGWIWRIPVHSRLGTGLVFNRTVTDIDTAKEFLVNYSKNKISKDDLKIIDWTPFYIKNPWHENVASIGLSSGFIEPLESTGIMLITNYIRNVTAILKKGYFTKHDIQQFNYMRCFQFEQTVDFVSLHYFNSQKTGKFWEFVRNTLTPTENQNKLINAITQPTNTTIAEFTNAMFDLWPGQRWMSWYAGLGHNVPAYNTGLSPSEAKIKLINFFREREGKIKSVDLVEEINTVRAGQLGKIRTQDQDDLLR